MQTSVLVCNKLEIVLVIFGLRENEFLESVLKITVLSWVRTEERSPIGQAELFRLENERKMQIDKQKTNQLKQELQTLMVVERKVFLEIAVLWNWNELKNARSRQ